MAGSPHFPSTMWSLVLMARNRPDERSEQALARLCEGYWYPVYAYIRRKGNESERARDLTQEFFARLIEKDYLATVDRTKGCFRAFLLTAVQRFLCNQLEHDLALKRGGGKTIESMDWQQAEGRYRLEPSDRVTPEIVYERRWALTVLDRAMARLRAESTVAHFKELSSLLTGDSSRGSYAPLAAKLGVSESAIKVAVHRLRQEYRRAVRAEIAEVVNTTSEIDSEVRYLLDILRR